MDWDAAYSNADHVANSADYAPRWKTEAQAFRDSLGSRAELDLSYGPGDRERYDLLLPEGAPNGLAVFVHGGYWHRHDKNVFSHLAQGALALGRAVAIPGYTLCPAARVHEITGQILRAVIAASARVAGPIDLAGHSAGGHLVTRMLCEDVALPAAVGHRLHRVASISGVHDLRPLLRTQMNATLHLDMAEAMAESPALAVPRDGADVLCWVGGAELPEFRRQNALLANIWQGFGTRITAMEAPGRHHLNVVDDLRDPDSTLINTWLKD